LLKQSDVDDFHASQLEAERAAVAAQANDFEDD
jgi:hypothetical protein